MAIESGHNSRQSFGCGSPECGSPALVCPVQQLHRVGARPAALLREPKVSETAGNAHR